MSKDVNASLEHALSTHAGTRVLGLLEEFGAVLLRGWHVDSADALAGAVAALKAHGLECLHEYFPAEHGRDERHTASGATIWPTNSLKPTGNYLVPEVLPHTENFYSEPVPRVVAFACERAPWVGGETAIFDGASVLGDLPPALRERLSSPCAAHRVLSLARLRWRHGIDSIDAIAQQLRGRAAIRPITNVAGFVALELPRVVCSAALPPPLTIHSEPAVCLAFNFGEVSSCRSARVALLRGLLARGLFAGRVWALHRMLWSLAFRWPRSIGKLLPLLDAIPCWCARPWSMLRAHLHSYGAAAAEDAAFTSSASSSASVSATSASTAAAAASPISPVSRAHGVRNRATKPTSSLPAALERAPSLSEVLSDRDAEVLAAALARSMAAFAWRRGDMLLLDNARVLHEGLPGVGPRKLHVALLSQAK